MSDEREDTGMSEEGREALGVLLIEYLDGPQSEWLYQEIEGQPDDYKVEFELRRPDGGTTIVRTDAGVIRLHVNATVQTVEAKSSDEEE